MLLWIASYVLGGCQLYFSIIRRVDHLGCVRSCRNGGSRCGHVFLECSGKFLYMELPSLGVSTIIIKNGLEQMFVTMC